MAGLRQFAGRCRRALIRRLRRTLKPAGPPIEPVVEDVDHAADPAAWAAGHLMQAGGGPVDAAALLESHRQEQRAATPAHALAGLRDVVRQDFSGSAAAAIARADAAAGGTFAMLGAGPFTFDGAVDWSSDLAGRTWLKGPRTELAESLYTNFPGNEHVIGDVKVPWELNKHLQFCDLARASVLTGDRRYGDAFREQMESWWAQNPFDENLAWLEPLIVGHRAVAWVLSMRMLIHAPAVDGPFYLKYLASLYDHVRFIRAHYEIDGPTSNHLWGDLGGVLTATAAHPEFDLAEDAWSEACGILAGPAAGQVYADGVQYEQSVSYERVILEFLLAAEVVAKHAERVLPDEARSAGRRMARHLMHVISPNGQANLISDADGARAWIFDTDDVDDYRPQLALAAAVYGDGELAGMADGHREAVCWLLGPDAAMPAATQPAATGAWFPHGGCVVMRSAWDMSASHLTFDCGDIGMGYDDDAAHATHGHDDLLSITLSGRGRQLLVDPGSGAYTGDLELHDRLRQSQAHNTVCISAPTGGDVGDVESHSVLGGAWSLSGRARPVGVQVGLTDEIDIALAGHDGYRRMPGRPLHRRVVIYLKPDTWVIVDCVEATASLPADATCIWRMPLVFHPDCEVDARPGNFTARNGDALLTGQLAAGDAPIPPRSERFPFAVDYGRCVETTRLTFDRTGTLPMASVLLLRVGDDEPSPATIDAKWTEGEGIEFPVVGAELQVSGVLRPAGIVDDEGAQLRVEYDVGGMSGIRTIGGEA